MNQWQFFKFFVILAAICTVHGLDRGRTTYDPHASVDFLQAESGNNPLASNNGNPSKTKVKDLVNFYDKQSTTGPGKTPSYSSILQGNKQQGTTKPPLNSPTSQATKGTSPQIQGSLPSKGLPSVSTVPPNVTPNKPTLSPISFPSLPNAKGTPSPALSPGNKPVLPPAFPSLKPGSPLQSGTPPSFSSIVSGGKVSSPTPSTAKPSSYSTVVAGTKPGESPTPTIKPSTPGRPSTPVLPSSLANNRPTSQSSNTNGPTDAELQTLSEELLRKDSNNAAKYVNVNYQGKTTSGSKEDKAPLPLLTISDAAWRIPTIQKFVPLLDNYERDTLVNEYITPQERIEENEFMDVIMVTPVIRHLMTFLRDKGYVTPDPKQQRDFLKALWFNMYSRGKGKISSSGFEHVFVSELKNGEVSGLHNWIYFNKEESANRINYLGYLKYLEFNEKGSVLKFHFNQQGTDKPVDSMFIGTSPELEIALYSLCFITRADRDCPLKLAGKSVDLKTYNFRYRSKNMIGSAFPQI